MKSEILCVLAFLLISVFFFQPLTVTAGDTAKAITWYRADFPPVSIPSGDQKDEGFFDKTMYFLIQQLPEYTHRFEVANFKRIMMEIESGRNACCPSLYKTKEREAYVAFSEPAMIVMPNGIIGSEASRAKLSAHLDSDGKLSLNSFLNDENITVGISNGRVYSGGIDQILEQFQGRKNLMVRSGDDVFRGLISMMQKGRIDCLIGYPVEAGYFARNNGNFNDFVYYPIKESSVDYTVGHIGCPNNSWGRKVIEEIDKVVVQHRDKEFIDFYGEWLDEDTRTVHRRMAEEHFRSQD